MENGESARLIDMVADQGIVGTGLSRGEVCVIGVLLALALQTATAVDPPPELRRTADGDLIIDSPDRDIMTIRFRFDRLVTIPTSERLQHLVGIEPFRVVEENGDLVTVRLSRSAAFAMDPNVFPRVGLVSMTPEPPRQLSRTCFSLFVELSLDERPTVPVEAAHPIVCPPSEIADQLIIEGRDRQGRSLWFAAAPDDREVRAVMGPDGRHGPPVRVERESLGALIAVPTVARLARLRWYEVTPDRQLRLIGEQEWHTR